MKKDKGKKPKQDLHQDMKGFDIQLNAFGQIESTMRIEALNDFLNKHVEDRKLVQKSKGSGEEE
jgi:hypothetical protein